MKARLGSALLVLLAGCAPAARPSRPCTFSGTGDTARVFTVTHRVTVDDAKTAGTFAASFRRHLDNAGDCLSQTKPNVLLFPEDSGLVAWFIGRQGLAGRNVGDAAGAFESLYGQHYPAADAYRRKFPGISDARALTLALSDRAWRAMDQTFGTIAKDANAWVVTSANLPYSQTVSGDSAAIFRDPDAAGPAYVATGAEVFNAALVYAPTGERVGRVDKVFLTDPEEQTLDLSSGPLESLGVVQLPFAKLGIAISRDAFYAPFVQRLDDLGVDFLVQPEAFSGWVGEELTGDWLPDVMLASGWSVTQKYTSVRHAAAPMLTGNLLDLSFDGQSFITSKSTPAQPRRGFIASETNGGFEAIGEWAHPEPDAGAPLAERQLAVRDLGFDLLPNSHAFESGWTEDSVVGADLHFGEPVPQPAGVTTSMRVAGAARGHQRNPVIAYGANNDVYVAWTDERSGAPRTWVTRSEDDGATWAEAHAVDPEPGTSTQLRPTIAAGTDGFVVVAWQDSARGSDQIRWAVSRDGARTFVASWAERSTRSQWEPSVVAFGNSGWAIAWTDFRNGLAPHARVRCFDIFQPQPALSRAIDPSTIDLPRAQPSQLQPSLAGTKPTELFAAWVDYRERDWQVRARGGPLCDDDGLSVKLSAASTTEVLGADPQTVLAPDGRLLVTWDEIRDRRGHHEVAAATLTRGVWQLQTAPTPVAWSRFRPAPFYLGGFHSVLQDMAGGKNTLSLWRPGTPAPVRFDDSGDFPNQLTRPRAAGRKDSTAAVVVFEDDREGWVRVRSLPLRP